LTITSAPARSAASIPAANRPGETLVAPQTDDVIDPGGLGHGDRLVGAAVVDDHPFDVREAGHRARQARERDAERGRFVEAGDLDD
jgi:hypothetical protein